MVYNINKLNYPDKITHPACILLSNDKTKLYIINSNNTIIIIDTNTLKIINTIVDSKFNIITNIVLSPINNIAYIVNYGNNNILIFDTNSDEIIGIVQDPANTIYFPLNIVFTSDGTNAYVINESKVISIIDTSSDSVINTFSSQGQPYNISVSPKNNTSYIVNTKLSRINILTNALMIKKNAFEVTDYIINSDESILNPLNCIFSPYNDIAYVLNTVNKDIIIINTITNTIIGSINNLDDFAQHILFGSEQSLIYIITINSILIFDISSNNIIETINIGSSNSYGLYNFVLSESNRIYMINKAENIIYYIDIINIKSSITTSVSPKTTFVSPVTTSISPKTTFVSPVTTSISPKTTSNTSKASNLIYYIIAVIILILIVLSVYMIFLRVKL